MKITKQFTMAGKNHRKIFFIKDETNKLIFRGLVAASTETKNKQYNKQLPHNYAT